VKLALLAESDDAAVAVDVMTAKLSGNDHLHLLERDEIDKAWREQGQSAANRDDLKLGRILGADGLLIFELVKTPQGTNLMARLIAVKPGVILTDGSFPWPIKDPAQWAGSVSAYFDVLLPKLSVPVQAAIPISVVNLRSAIASADAAETERELKLLTIQRLSQERQFFVLERQKMQLLSDEKDFKADDSAFWNGSYLLEGVVDQNGYSPETVTIDVRLAPRQGGVALTFAVSGSRTNLAEVINKLAAKVAEVLKVNSTVREWNAADEAAKYYAEAGWALQWGVFEEAQAAADSAWALGRRDQDCAMLRVRTYMVSPDAGLKWIVYPPTECPAPGNITAVIHAFEIYNDSSRALPAGEPKPDSDWYHLGIDNLTVAARLLQVFNWSPDFYQPVSDRLAELRAAARTTAGWIARSSSVHDSYFVGDRVAHYDELYHFEEKPSIFSLELDCGCLWQEHPEDSVAMYRELMSSPVFCYFHNRFWFRDADHNSSLHVSPPRLIAWNSEDQPRIPLVWNNFVQELSASSNALLQLEAKALRLVDSTNAVMTAGSFTNFFETMLEDHDALVTNNVEVLYLAWHAGDLAEQTYGGLDSDTKESLRQLYYSHYGPKLAEFDKEYQRHGGKDATVFGKQKQFLEAKAPFDPQQFVQLFLFDSQDYSKAQAQEIQPLLAAYKKQLTGIWATAGAMQVGEVEKAADRILNPASPAPHPPVQIQPVQPAAVVLAAPVAVPLAEAVTNVLTVNSFMEIPLASILQSSGLDGVSSSNLTISAHHWVEGKLLLNFEYALYNNHTGGSASGSAVAIFDPATKSWTVANHEKEEIQSQNNYYHRSTLLHGQLFNCDGGKIEKYDSSSQQWNPLAVSDGNNYELFSLNGHLYAASGEIIFEIADDEKSTRILASARRNPRVSKMDGDNFGLPTLFEGADHSLKVCTQDKIFTWMGDDWREDSDAPPHEPGWRPDGTPHDSSDPEIFLDGVLFRRAGSLNAAFQNGVLVRRENGAYGMLVSQDEITCLANETTVAKLCLKGSQDDWRRSSPPGTKTVQVPKPFWKMPANLLPDLPAAWRQSDLYLLEDNFAARVMINERHEIRQENSSTNDAYNSALLCFSHELPLPQKLFLRFEAPDVKTPTWMFPTTNRFFFGNSAGFWMVPVYKIDSAITAQKQAQQEQKARDDAEKAATAEKAQKAFLSEFDRNHNGVIDPEEREAALDDPVFIGFELDMIDANHNGWLDAGELGYFDANTNKILEPKEQAGIDIAQHLFAERLLKKFDANGDGFLERPEFQNLFQSSFPADTRSRYANLTPFPDDNRDGKIDLGELEAFLKQQTRRDLRSHGTPGAAVYNQIRTNANPRADPRQMFKAAVENYWQNAGGASN
jgi:Ca2+-binding EF-hand superfamily protein